MIHIDDNFFDDPYTIRNIAFKQHYEFGGGNYPGVRSRSIPQNISNQVISKVRYFSQDSGLDISSIHFQYVTKEYTDGLFHTDWIFKYLCIVYLSLDPPVNSGTEICDYDQERDTIDGEVGVTTPTSPTNSRALSHLIQRDFHKNPTSLLMRFRYGRLKRRMNSHYKPIVKVPNKFNRGIIFPAANFHRSQYSFGTSIENSRLTIVSFFK